jgi:3-oxoadipate enol-lactonase
MEYVMSDGLRLASRVDGTPGAPPLIFSNSLGCDLSMWDDQVAALGSRFRIVRYDTRGHGQSGVPSEPATIDQLGRDLLAVLDHYSIERAHMCGLSVGGLTALWVAAMHPGRVDKAVFADTAARIGTVESWSARIDAVRDGGMAAIRDTVIGRFFSEGIRARRPDVAERFARTLEAINPIGYTAVCSALHDADLRPLVSRITAPSLIVVGELDEATPPSQSRELHAAISGSELVVLPEASHLSNIEQPGAFNACLLRFLTGG